MGLTDTQYQKFKSLKAKQKVAFIKLLKEVLTAPQVPVLYQG